MGGADEVADVVDDILWQVDVVLVDKIIQHVP